MALPDEARSIADKSFELLKADSRHPSLHFKRIGPVWSARVGATIGRSGAGRDSVVLDWHSCRI
jgi:hypothetical protein